MPSSSGASQKKSKDDKSRNTSNSRKSSPRTSYSKGSKRRPSNEDLQKNPKRSNAVIGGSNCNIANISMENLSTVEIESQPDGVISDAEQQETSQASQIPSAQPGTSQLNHDNSPVIRTRTFTNARVNIESPEFIQRLPQTTRSVYIQSAEEGTVVAKVNPIVLGKAVDHICGPVERIQHLKNGGLFIHCTANFFHRLLCYLMQHALD